MGFRDDGPRAGRRVAVGSVATSGGCTRSSSTVPCSRRSPRFRRTGSADARRSGRARLAALGSRIRPARWPHPRHSPGHLASSGDPTPAPAGRCSSGSPTSPARTPACSRSAGSPRTGRHPLVPPQASRRGRGRRAARTDSGDQPLRHRPAAARARASRCWATTPARAASRRAGCTPRCWLTPSAAAHPEEAVLAIRASAAASCSGSAWPTCCGRSASPRSATR